MDKEIVDKIIIDYQDKLYGFALSKTKDIEQAEELGSQITFEVYLSLLKVDKIYNVNSYIYRIACNVYSRFIKEIKNETQTYFQETSVPDEAETQKDENHARIRREISFLSNLQREIVVMYYYQKLKINEIASRLSINPGKVKWHLFDARNQIKQGFLEEKNDFSSLQTIKFTQMIQFGHSSPLNIDMSFYFYSELSHAIAYLAYRNPRTSVEIAKQMSIAVSFVEDEINYLVENRFLTRLPGNKYLTNIYLTENNEEQQKMNDEILDKYVEYVTNLYIPLLFNNMFDKYIVCDYKELPLNKIYTPENDLNFLMWSIVSYACKHKLVNFNNKKSLFNYAVKRNDGSAYIAAATVDVDGCSSRNRLRDYGDLYSGDESHCLNTWEFFSQFDDKKRKPNLQLELIFSPLLDFIKGNLKKETANVDKYISLYEKRLIINLSKTDLLNVVLTSFTQSKFLDLLPKIPKELLALGKKLDEEMYVYNKDFYPQHMQNLSRLKYQNTLTSGQMRVRVLDRLLKNNILKPLKKHQKMTANMIVFG